MDTLVLMFLCSIAPAAFLVYYVCRKDREKPEPMKLVMKALFYGVCSVGITLLIHEIWFPLPYALGMGWIYETPILGSVMTAFYNAAIPEETAKLMMLWLFVRQSKHFDEHMDGIVYAVCIGMGFAGLENIQYVFSDEESWRSIAIMRSLFAVPGHYIFAVLMGFFYSLVYFQPKRFGKYRGLIWIAPILAHGVYDTICMVGAENMLSLLIYVPLIWFCIKMHKFCHRRIIHMGLFDEDKKELETFVKAVQEMEGRGENYNKA